MVLGDDGLVYVGDKNFVLVCALGFELSLMLASVLGDGGSLVARNLK